MKKQDLFSLFQKSKVYNLDSISGGKLILQASTTDCGGNPTEIGGNPNADVTVCHDTDEPT